jgi:hypothetical protein
MRFQTTLRLLQMTGPRSSVHSLRELRVVLMLRPPCASLNTAVAAITARQTSARATQRPPGPGSYSSPNPATLTEKTSPAAVGPK